MTDINTNPAPVPVNQIPVDPQPVVTSPIPPLAQPPSEPEQSASRLEQDRGQGKVLTAEEVHGKPGTVILALVALVVLAGAATVFYLNSLGAAKPETYVMEGNKKTVKVKPSPSSATSVSDDSVMGIKDDLNKITADDFTSDFSQIEKEAQSL